MIAFRLHPQLHGFHGRAGQFVAPCLSRVVREVGIVAHALYLVKVLYLREGMLCHGLVLVKHLLEVAAYVRHAAYEAHVGLCLEGRLIACKKSHVN